MRTFVSLIGVLALSALAACSQPEDTHEHVMQDHDGHEMTEHDQMPLADDGVTPVIDLRMAWMRPHPNGRDMTAAYFVVYLAEGSADRLLSARIDGASSVELHGHMIGENGMMQMRPIGAQDITDAGPMIFTPGGRHLMVHGLSAVVEGDSVEGVLVFERSGEFPVTFEVSAMPPGSPNEY